MTFIGGISVQNLKKEYIEKRFLKRDLGSKIFNVHVINFLGSCNKLELSSKINISYMIINYYKQCVNQNNGNFFCKQDIYMIANKIYQYRLFFQNINKENTKDAVFDLSKLLS